MARLPLAPPLLPDEALSSWIARIAARYDLSADALIQHLLPQESDSSGVVRRLDVCAYPVLEAALATATGVPAPRLAAQRLADLAARPAAAWLRDRPAWCPVCAFVDVAARGEVHAHRSWVAGATLICPLHGCLLASTCPRCHQRVTYQPRHGRLRLWCSGCEDTADAALEPHRVPYWPLGLPQPRRRCPAVSLSAASRPLLLRVQRALLASLTGKRIRSSWARRLPRGQAGDILRKLCFLMLGPLWEPAERPPACWDAATAAWRLPDDWSPGCLASVVAAPTLLTAVTFLAAENGAPLRGVTWEPLTLLNGEPATIDGQTLPWHLNADDARLARRLFSAAWEPFAPLLGALCGAGREFAIARETRRRRCGLGGGLRRARLIAQARANETALARDARERRERNRLPPADRYAFSRLVPEAPAPARPQVSPQGAFIAALVFAAIGADPDDADVVHRFGVARTRMESRYIRYWVLRHVDRGAQELAASLADALERARQQNRGLVLPEWPAAPTQGRC